MSATWSSSVGPVAAVMFAEERYGETVSSCVTSGFVAETGCARTRRFQWCSNLIFLWSRLIDELRSGSCGVQLGLEVAAQIFLAELNTRR